MNDLAILGFTIFTALITFFAGLGFGVGVKYMSSDPSEDRKHLKGVLSGLLAGLVTLVFLTQTLRVLMS